MFCIAIWRARSKRPCTEDGRRVRDAARQVRPCGGSGAVVGSLVKPAGAAVVESLHFRARRLGKLLTEDRMAKAKKRTAKKKARKAAKKKKLAGRKAAARKVVARRKAAKKRPTIKSARRKAAKKKPAVRKKAALRPAATLPASAAPAPLAPRPVAIPGAWPFPMGNRP